MNRLLSYVAMFLLGGLLSGLLMLPVASTSISGVLKTVNDDYAAVLGVLLTSILLLITFMYVVLTHLQVKASKESVALSRRFLEQAHKQLRHSNIPVLIPEVTKTSGTRYFGARRRQLHLTCKIKNIGDGPAIRVHTRIKFVYKHVQFLYYDEYAEYSFIGNTGIGEERTAEMHFETEKIEKMIEDFAIAHAKNTFRVKHNPFQNPYPTPDFSVELIYANVHGQYFRSCLVHPLGYIEAYQRARKEDQRIYWTSETPLGDDESFKLSFLNPIFQTFSFDPVDDPEAEEFMARYRELVGR